MSTSEPDETSGLLASSQGEHEQDRRGSLHRALASYFGVLHVNVICILVLQFITMFAFYHLLAPKLWLLELSICRLYYEEHDPSAIEPKSAWPGYYIEEARCKANPIQHRLSVLRAWGVLLDGVCVLCLSIPYGILADRYGRKLVYCICLVGLISSNVWFLIVCSLYDRLPLTAVLASSAFLVLGGGSSVLIAIAVTMGSDVRQEKDRSIVLYWLLSMYFLGYVSGTGLSPITMRVAWIPYFISLFIWVIAFILTIFAPLSRPGVGSSSDVAVTPANVSPVSWSKGYRSMLNDSCQWIRNHSQIILVVILFPLMATRGALPELVLPYVSKRYSWPLSRAAVLDSVGGAIGLLLGLVVLPALVQSLQARSGRSVADANRLVASWSATSLSVGALIVGFAGTIHVMIIGFILYSLGFGVRMAVLAVASSLVPPQQLARLNTIVITSETIADLTCSPLLWKLWGTAIEVGGAALGLPWFVVAVAYSIVLILLLSMRSSQDIEHIHDEEPGEVEG